MALSDGVENGGVEIKTHVKGREKGKKRRKGGEKLRREKRERRGRRRGGAERNSLCDYKSSIIKRENFRFSIGKQARRLILVISS